MNSGNTYKLGEIILIMPCFWALSDFSRAVFSLRPVWTPYCHISFLRFCPHQFVRRFFRSSQWDHGPFLSWVNSGDCSSCFFQTLLSGSSGFLDIDQYSAEGLKGPFWRAPGLPALSHACSHVCLSLSLILPPSFPPPPPGHFPLPLPFTSSHHLCLSLYLCSYLFSSIFPHKTLGAVVSPNFKFCLLHSASLPGSV